ncbi:hypothetical protein GCM10010168_46450 [Actinoplanes ianthinogenes]|uniref:Uncharacterized protein n=1 Tax=Actinoplanes ianthinogenes TaxID=122358 RepID=A0ABM7LP42_9ACTN|nr:hypothetical protein [Actinoplanes ianthinogenes]BCJ41057.1 hypothetical protein Aiant_17140 [Actinoplanes ianthinogenes]GGR23189.1 hypothetical protein GCM10010168_46450 [Actinoplanes ianthinogenes]
MPSIEPEQGSAESTTSGTPAADRRFEELLKALLMANPRDTLRLLCNVPVDDDTEVEVVDLGLAGQWEAVVRRKDAGDT